MFATGYARYQFTSRSGLGGGANVRDSDSDAWSVFGFADQENRWGIGRAQADYATDDDRDSMQLTLDQTWQTPPSTRLNTSVMVGREQLADDSTNLFGIAVNGGGSLWSSLALDVNARWDRAGGSQSYDNILASVALNWVIRRGWTVGGNFYVNRNTGRIPLEVSSPIPGEPTFINQTVDDQGFYLSLRYNWQAGTRSAPLAGMPGSGSGSLAGVLFLDANDNGRQDAGESGAANVTVLLNGRFPDADRWDGPVRVSNGRGRQSRADRRAGQPAPAVGVPDAGWHQRQGRRPRSGLRRVAGPAHALTCTTSRPCRTVQHWAQYGCAPPQNR